MAMIIPTDGTFLKGTTAMWAVYTDIIPVGLPCVEILINDSIVFKIGDGVHPFSQLPSYASSQGFELEPFLPNHYYTQYSLVYEPNTVKGLAIAKLTFTSGASFNANDWYIAGDFYNKSEIDLLLQNKANVSAIDKTIATGLSVSQDATSLTLGVATINLSTGTTGTSNVTFPLASSSQHGAITKEAYAQISQNTTDISSLKGKVSRYVGDFSTAVDPDNPTQGELNAIYQAASGEAPPPEDGITLVNLDNSKEYTWYTSETLWFSASAAIPAFTEGGLGLIRGASTTDEGKIFAEANGTGSLVGFDELENAEDNKVTTLTSSSTNTQYPSAKATYDYGQSGLPAGDVYTTDNSDGGTGLEDHRTALEKITDDYEGYQDDRDILNLKVTKDGTMQTVEGLAVNGIRIDFDHNSLVIKNKDEETKYDLTNGPYNITSAYGAIECYGKLFIFDEKVAGKGIIRDKTTGTITEVTNLGIYAESGSINVIHIIDQEDRDVCYVLNSKNQSNTLVVYPDGTYKVVDFTTSARTPQNISDIILLTSVNGTRHSLYMRQTHPLNTATNTTPTELIVFQLEDAAFRVLDNSSPECSGRPSAGTFTIAATLGNRIYSWEGHTDIDDPEISYRDTIDTSYADSNDNRRLPYPTGVWNSESGSVRKDMRYRAQHNGIYRHHLGAMILGDYNTTLQHVLVTPEGFIGWFSVETLSYWYYIDWREVEIKSGPYAGQRGIFFYSINQASSCTFIVNTPDGDPDKTVCVNLKTNLNNLNHLSGLNVIAAAFTSYPTRVFTTYNRILCSWQADTSNNRYFPYINQAEIAPNTFDGTAWTQHFDYHVLDVTLDTGYASSTFNPLSWEDMTRIDFVPDGYKGILVRGSGYNTSMYIPDDSDTWDGTTGVRPYAIQHPSNLAPAIDRWEQDDNMFWLAKKHMKAIWHNHLITCATGNIGYVFDWYFDTTAEKLTVRQHTYATGTYYYFPIVLDQTHLILWSGENITKVGVFTWDDIAQDFTFADNPNAWTPPRGTNGNILYRHLPTAAEYDSGLRAELYFFDTRTARADYLKLDYSVISGQDTVNWSLLTAPKSMTAAAVLKVPISNRILLFNNTADTAAYMFNVRTGGTSITVSYGDSIVIRHIYDISNTYNASESTFGAYALFGNSNYAYLYILEWDYEAMQPQITKYQKRANVNRRIWALPPVENNGITEARFAVGNNVTLASTASSPFTIITRVGGVIDALHPAPQQQYTRVRDYGTSDVVSGAVAKTARVDLAIPATIWDEPRLNPNVQGGVRFIGRKTQTIVTSSYEHCGQNGDVSILGFKYDNNGIPIPVYGEHLRIRDTGSDYSAELKEVDDYICEIGATYNQDSMIYMGQGYGFALVLADQWTAHPTNTEFATGSTFAGGPTATIWGSYGAGDNYNTSRLTWVVVENRIVGASPITDHMDGQYTHEAGFSPYGVGLGPTSAYGFSAFRPYFRKGKMLFRDFTLSANVSNWSLNGAPIVFDMNLNLPYAAWTAAQYTTLKGTPVIPAMTVSQLIPLFQYFDNQILPGLYHRRNNELPNDLTNNIVPYFRFSDEDFDLLWANYSGTSYYPGTVFTDKQKISPLRYDVAGNIYASRELLDTDTGDTEVLRYFLNDGNPKLDLIDLINNQEFVKRIVCLQNEIHFYGATHHWVYYVDTQTLELSGTSPDPNAVLSFDKDIEVVSFRDDDNDALWVYLMNQLVLEYHGEQIQTIPLHNLVLTGNTFMEDLVVSRNIRTNTLEAARIIVPSVFNKVIF